MSPLSKERGPWVWDTSGAGGSKGVGRWIGRRRYSIISVFYFEVLSTPIRRFVLNNPEIKSHTFHQLSQPGTPIISLSI